MDNAPKIFLTLELEGSTCHVKSVEKRDFVVRLKDTFGFKKKTKKKENKEDGNKVIKQGTYDAKILECVPAVKHLNLCRDAYDYMVSSEVPHWFTVKSGDRIKTWRRMSEKERLNSHMSHIASSEGAIRFSYNILED